MMPFALLCNIYLRQYKTTGCADCDNLQVHCPTCTHQVLGPLACSKTLMPAALSSARHVTTAVICAIDHYLLEALEASSPALLLHALQNGALHLVVIAQGIQVLSQPPGGCPRLQRLRVRNDDSHELRSQTVAIHKGLGNKRTPHVHILNLLWGYVLALHARQQQSDAACWRFAAAVGSCTVAATSDGLKIRANHKYHTSCCVQSHAAVASVTV